MFGNHKQKEHHEDFIGADLITVFENYVSSWGQHLLSNSLVVLSEHPQQGEKWTESCWTPWPWIAASSSER